MNSLKCILTAMVITLASSSVFGQYTGSNENVASLSTIAASDSIIGHEPEYAVDTIDGTYLAIPGPPPAWIEIDLGSFYLIDGIGILAPNSGELPESITCQLSADGTIWNNVAVLEFIEEGLEEIDIAHFTHVRYARFNITAKNDTASIEDLRVYGSFFYPPETPQTLPATNVESDGFTANWSEVSDVYGYRLTVAYDQFMGNKVPGYQSLEVGTVHSWDVSGLDPVTTYYYSVVAYNSTGASDRSEALLVTTSKYTQTIDFEPLEDKTYGDSDFVLSAIASSGLDVNFTLSTDSVIVLSGDTAKIMGPGSVVISASQEGNDLYDAAESIDQILIVNRKELTVSGISVSDKTYDGTIFATVNGAVLEGVVPGDDILLENAENGVFERPEAGNDIPVTLNMSLSGVDHDKYILTAPSGFSADIAKKDLIVTAQSTSRLICEPNPLYTLIIEGFIEGENEDDLSTIPMATSEADDQSPEGTYSIVPSGGIADNYHFTYAEGTLSIEADTIPPKLTVRSHTVTLNNNGFAVLEPEDLITTLTDNCGNNVYTSIDPDTITANELGIVIITVTATDDSGNTATAHATVTVLVTSDLKKETGIDLNIYPNPSSGIIEIKTSYVPMMLTILESSGKVLLQKTLHNSLETIDLKDYSDGLYILQFTNQDFHKVVKIMKK